MKNKRILSVLLSAAMLFSFVPATGVAASAANDPTVIADNIDFGGSDVAAQKDGNKYLMAYGAKNNNDAFTFEFTADENLCVGTEYTFAFDIRNEVTGTGERAIRLFDNYIKVGGTGCNADVKPSFTNAYEWQRKTVVFTPKVESDKVSIKIQFGTTSEVQTTPFCLDNLEIYASSTPAVKLYSQNFEDTAWQVGAEGVKNVPLRADGLVCTVNPQYGNHIVYDETNMKKYPKYVKNDPLYTGADEVTKAAWDEAIADYNNGVTNTYDTSESDVHVTIVEEIDYRAKKADNGVFTYDAVDAVLSAGKYKLTALVRNEEYNAAGTHTNGTSSGNWLTYYPSTHALTNVTVSGQASTNLAKYRVSTAYWLYNGNHNGKIFENLNNFGLTAKINTAGKTYTGKVVNLNYLWTEYEFEFDVKTSTTLDSIVFETEHAKADVNYANLGYRDIKLVQLEETEDAEPLALAVSAPAAAAAGDEFEVEILAYSEMDEVQKLSSVGFVVDYDDELIELVSVESSDYAGDMSVAYGANYAWFCLASGGVEIGTEAKAIAVATFKVLDGAVAGETEITLTGDSTTSLGYKLYGISEELVPAVTADKVAIVNNAEVAITVEPTEGGSVSADSALAPVGTTITASGNKLTVGDTEIVATADEKYNFVGWFIDDTAIPAAGYAVTTNDDITVTAKFTIGSASLTFAAEVNGTVDKTSATVDAGSLITVSDNKLMSGSETLATATANANYRFEGWYLDGVKVTAPVDVVKDGSYAFTAKFELDVKAVTFAAGANGTVDKTSAEVKVGDAITVNGNKLTIGTVTATATPDAGYKFAGWKLNGAAVTAGTVTADGTYAFTAEFEKDTYKMTVPAGVTVTVNGDETEGGDGVTVDVQIGDEIIVTPDDDSMITAVYSNGTELDYADGGYTVPAESITEGIEITFDEIDYEFVTAKQYRALASDDYKIVMIYADANYTDYTLGDYDFYYSEKYEAYVAIIDAELTAAEIGQDIEFKAGSEIAVNYDGDVNGDGKVSSADSAIVNELLHAYNSADTEYTDIMRFRADVFGTYTDGSAYITSADSAWILYKAVGLDYPNN